MPVMHGLALNMLGPKERWFSKIRKGAHNNLANKNIENTNPGVHNAIDMMGLNTQTCCS
jgi:hypothetical protein